MSTAKKAPAKKKAAPRKRTASAKKAVRPKLKAGAVSVQSGRILLEIVLDGAKQAETAKIEITPSKLAEILGAVPWPLVMQVNGIDSFEEAREALKAIEALNAE